ncbi:MAG: hypothetical protein CNLJKLNK_00240 [Holosporales bacterium]
MNPFFMTFMFAFLSIYASAPDASSDETAEHQIGSPPELTTLFQNMYEGGAWQNLENYGYSYGASTLSDGRIIETCLYMVPYIPEYSSQMLSDGLWTNRVQSYLDDLDEIAPPNDPLFPDWQIHSHGIVYTLNGAFKQCVYYRIR